MTETVRYVARCRACGHKGAFDAELVTQTVQGRDYTNPVIRLLTEDFVVPDTLNGGTRTVEQAGWLYLVVPDGRARIRFSLDLDGVGMQALKRLGLWCACDNVIELRVKALKATRNEAKRCGSACHSAVSATCDCSCGGKSHASAWIPQFVRPTMIGA